MDKIHKKEIQNNYRHRNWQHENHRYM